MSGHLNAVSATPDGMGCTSSVSRRDSHNSFKIILVGADDAGRQINQEINKEGPEGHISDT